jgi:plastocyanin
MRSSLIKYRTTGQRKEAHEATGLLRDGALRLGRAGVRDRRRGVGGGEPQEEVVVSIRDNYFDPADIVVAPGMTVEWVNEGANPHSVVADNGLFYSGLSYSGDSYSVTFDGKDTVTYHCSPEITGSVTVAWEERRVRPKREPAEEEGTFETFGVQAGLAGRKSGS